MPQLKVKGSGGILGELVLPELRAVSLELEGPEQEVFSEVLAARWPKLERFELWDRGGEVELEPLLHVLSTVPLTHLALPFTDQHAARPDAGVADSRFDPSAEVAVRLTPVSI